MGRTGAVIVRNGVVMKWSTFFGRYIKSSFPAIDLARHETLQHFLRGKEVFPGFTDAEREIAERFDLKKALEECIKAREAAGLPVDIDSKKHDT